MEERNVRTRSGTRLLPSADAFSSREATTMLITTAAACNKYITSRRVVRSLDKTRVARCRGRAARCGRFLTI